MIPNHETYHIFRLSTYGCHTRWCQSSQIFHHKHQSSMLTMPLIGVIKYGRQRPRIAGLMSLKWKCPTRRNKVSISRLPDSTKLHMYIICKYKVHIMYFPSLTIRIHTILCLILAVQCSYHRYDTISGTSSKYYTFRHWDDVAEVPKRRRWTRSSSTSIQLPPAEDKKPAKNGKQNFKNSNLVSSKRQTQHCCCVCRRWWWLVGRRSGNASPSERSFAEFCYIPIRWIYKHYERIYYWN